MAEFEREIRYIVFKVKDFEKVATSTERAIVEILATRIDEHRFHQNRKPVNCVVVEDDWPEYEAVWKMIEARVSGATPPPGDQVQEAVEAFTALLETHDEDIGMDEYADDESVGSESGPGPETPIVDMKLTFGVLRRARKSLQALAALSGEVRS